MTHLLGKRTEADKLTGSQFITHLFHDEVRVALLQDSRKPCGALADELCYAYGSLCSTRAWCMRVQDNNRGPRGERAPSWVLSAPSLGAIVGKNSAPLEPLAHL